MIKRQYSISMLNKCIAGVLFFSISVTHVFSQVKPTTKPATDTAKIKLVPKFGAYGDSSKTTVAALKQLLKTQLTVADAKGNTWNVIAFSFAWRQKNVINDKTGALKTVFLYNETKIVGDNHIPDAWQKEIQESLQSQEEILFDDILAQNIKTKKISKVAPLRIMVL